MPWITGSSPPQTRRFRSPQRIQPLYARRLRLAALLILCWLPCYISTFPGNFVCTTHPRGIIRRHWDFPRVAAAFGHHHAAALLSERLTGSVNGGIAAFTLLQMLFGAALFAHILYRFARYSLHPVALGLLTAYYALFPVIHLLITCTTRDVAFQRFAHMADRAFLRIQP